MFQHTAARRRLAGTHERGGRFEQCFNTQPPEGGWAFADMLPFIRQVSTHSRPKAAGAQYREAEAVNLVSTHSRPKAAGPKTIKSLPLMQFQHTAARRRLVGNAVFPALPGLFQHTAA